MHHICEYLGETKQEQVRDTHIIRDENNYEVMKCTILKLVMIHFQSLKGFNITVGSLIKISKKSTIPFIHIILISHLSSLSN